MGRGRNPSRKGRPSATTGPEQKSTIKGEGRETPESATIRTGGLDPLSQNGYIHHTHTTTRTHVQQERRPHKVRRKYIVGLMRPMPSGRILVTAPTIGLSKHDCRTPTGRVLLYEASPPFPTRMVRPGAMRQIQPGNTDGPHRSQDHDTENMEIQRIDARPLLYTSFERNKPKTAHMCTPCLCNASRCRWGVAKCPGGELSTSPTALGPGRIAR